MLADQLKTVLDKYFEVSQTRFGKSPFMDIVNHDIPELIVDRFQLDDTYKVYGSCGTGAWAETPWVAIINRAISTSTQNGYYIVFLFDAKKKILYITLAVGWVQFQTNFSSADALLRIEQYSNYLVQKLRHVPSGFQVGPIDLSARFALTKGYERGQIISKAYTLSEINDAVIENDITELLEAYEDIAKVAGDSILNIDYENILSQKDLSQEEIKINQATLIQDPEIALEQIQKLIKSVPPSKREATVKLAVRNRKIALYVKQKANFVCEVCSRQPFIQKNGKPYAEADHIVPLGGNTQGLDSPDNMRCLCAQCHAIITHGSDTERQQLLSLKTKV